MVRDRGSTVNWYLLAPIFLCAGGEIHKSLGRKDLRMRGWPAGLSPSGGDTYAKQV